MTWVSAGIGGATAIFGGIQALGAGKQKRRIAKEISKMKEVPLTNVAEGLQVSTRGAELQKENQARLAATQMDALSEGGSRSLIGGVGRVSAASQDVNATIAADLDAQQKNIDMVRAEDEGRIRNTKEERQRAKLAALSGQYNAAATQQQQGFGNIVSGVASAGAGVAGASGKKSKSSVNFTGEQWSVPQSLIKK